MLTVIICTYNREKYIRNLLESIAANTLPKDQYEILLVENNCTDNTHGVCQQFSAEHPEVNFRCVNEAEQGLSAARNRGIREAKGELLVYVDDDALVDDHYLMDFVTCFEQQPNVMAAGGPIEPLYETEEPAWMTSYTKALLCAWMNYGTEQRHYPSGRFPGGGNSAFRKEVFDKVGFFNTELGRKGGSLVASEEKDIFDKMHALGMEVVYLPGPVLHHIIPQAKLEKDYFDRVTYQIGCSERKRTQAISTGKYLKRLFSEAIKWGGTFVLWTSFFLRGERKKGDMLIAFRKNVTRGLFSKD